MVDFTRERGLDLSVSNTLVSVLAGLTVVGKVVTGMISGSTLSVCINSLNTGAV